MFNKTMAILFGVIALAGCSGTGDESYNINTGYTQDGADCIYTVPPGGRQFVDAEGVARTANEGDTIVYKNTQCADMYAQDNMIVPMQPVTDTNPVRTQPVVTPPVVVAPTPTDTITIAPSAQPTVVKVVCEAPPAKPAARATTAKKPAAKPVRKATAPKRIARNYDEPTPPPTLTTREWINGVEVPNPSTDICD